MNILRQRQELNNFGVSLHSRIVGLLINQIETAITDGRIRSVDQLYSIFDFIREILGLKSEREVWRRYITSDSNVVTICDNVQFLRSDGELNRESPATDMTGLLYIAYMANCEFSIALRSASASHFIADRKTSIVTPTVAAPIEEFDPSHFAHLVNKTQAEILKLANDYLQIREVASKAYPTLLPLLDTLADPAGLPEITKWFSVRIWLKNEGIKLTPRQYKHLCLAMADCHRFLTVTQPQKRDGICFYNNLHEPLLKACAENTLKLVRATVPFI